VADSNGSGKSIHPAVLAVRRRIGFAHFLGAFVLSLSYLVGAISTGTHHVGRGAGLVIFAIVAIPASPIVVSWLYARNTISTPGFRIHFYLGAIVAISVFVALVYAHAFDIRLGGPDIAPLLILQVTAYILAGWRLLEFPS
jgi:putative solute:sodium symporter small subunit